MSSFLLSEGALASGLKARTPSSWETRETCDGKSQKSFRKDGAGVERNRSRNRWRPTQCDRRRCGGAGSSCFCFRVLRKCPRSHKTGGHEAARRQHPDFSHPILPWSVLSALKFLHCGHSIGLPFAMETGRRGSAADGGAGGRQGYRCSEFCAPRRRTSVPSSDVKGDHQSGCVSVSLSSARPSVGRCLPKFNSKSLGTP